MALINGVAHIGNGQVIESALVAFNKGIIESVMPVKGLKLNPQSYDTVIDLQGKHIYPALINCNNVLGLHDAQAVRATRDYNEVGWINPHVRTLIAYNTDNQIIPTVKTNGVLYTQVCPRGGLISGSSSIMALEGWNWEDAVLKSDDGIHLNFPQNVSYNYSEEEGLSKKANKKFQDEVNALDQFFSDAKAYCSSNAHTEKNLRFEAMCAVFSGKANLYVHADRAKDILNAFNFISKFEIKKPVLIGGKECYKVLTDLKKNKIPVMLNRVNDLPDNDDDEVDLIFRLPALLQKDSILFCLQMEGDMEAAQSRNLPFNAGVAVGYGLGKEEALSAITLNAAKILGVENKLGSLEIGKLASIVVSEGDILDFSGNKITLAFIAGKPVDLNNRQVELYKKYKAKYGF